MEGSRLKKVGAHVGLVVGACLVTVTLMGGGPVGAFSVPNNSVTSIKVVDDTIRGIDIKDSTVAPVDLSPAARPRWAKVDAGTTTALLRGRGAVSALREDVGYYKVVFAGSLAGCGWSASRTNNDGVQGATSTATQLSIEYAPSVSTTSLWGRTWNAAGNPAEIPDNEGFVVVVHC